MAEESLALIKSIIDEHKVILADVQTLEEVSNDAEALVYIDRAKETFMPGRPGQGKGLLKLQEAAQKFDDGLRAHFNREETALLMIFEKNGDTKLATDFHSLLLEHDDLRNRLVHMKNHLAELAEGRLSKQVWEATAYDIKAHISHTRKLIEAHASIEMELFKKLQKNLRKELRKKA